MLRLGERFWPVLQCLAARSVEPKEQRMKEWRELLRHWHPDKNPHRIEVCPTVKLVPASCQLKPLQVATAVFQFLQKGKPMLEGG